MFNTHQLVKLLDTFAAATASCFQVTGIYADSKIRNKAVDGFATAVRHKTIIAVFIGKFNGF